MIDQEQFFEILRREPMENLGEQYPVVWDFFRNHRLELPEKQISFWEAAERADEEILEEFGLERSQLPGELYRLICAFEPEPLLLRSLSSLTVRGGRDKTGRPEDLSVTVRRGEIISIVGPTGAGKSRLLADIECLAAGDTPTGRVVLLEDRQPSEEERDFLEGKLVSQLSQNMNFVMDLTVEEFLTMHGECRLGKEGRTVARQCFECANQLAGEPFSPETKVTQLSGGQSRALMIADTAFMSEAPIVLIDEIENAGIDRRQAVELLARKEKIVLISTHDPLLALHADQRIIIGGGGIRAILKTSAAEKEALKKIEKMDRVLLALRSRLRKGERLEDVDDL